MQPDAASRDAASVDELLRLVAIDRDDVSGVDEAVEEIKRRIKQADDFAHSAHDCLLACEEREMKLRDALARALDFAEEGWGYVSDYFRKKWNYDGEIAALRGVLELRAEIGAQDA